MMLTEHESDNYAWNYDGLYGVGNFTRKRDGAVTYLETGSDCEELRESLDTLAAKTGAADYPKAAPGFASVFDAIASEYEFHD